MEKFIKYKRISGIYIESNLQKLFDGFITEGWEIVSYHEGDVVIVEESELAIEKIPVTIVVGKKQSQIL